jgi:hypothetical protein
MFPLINRVKPLHIVCRTVTTTSNKNECEYYIGSSAVSKTSASFVVMQNEDVEIPLDKYYAFAVAESVSTATVNWYQGDVQNEFPVNTTYGMGSVVKTATTITNIQENNITE